MTSLHFHQELLKYCSMYYIFMWSGYQMNAETSALYLNKLSFSSTMGNWGKESSSLTLTSQILTAFENLSFNLILSFDSQIEHDLLDAIIFHFTTVIDGGLNATEVSFAIVILVKLSEIYDCLKPFLTRRLACYERSWFKSKTTLTTT